MNDLADEWGRSAPTYWEPIKFQAFQRVKIRVAAECDQHARAADPGVIDQIDGQTGTVCAIDNSERPGHPYIVLIDRPFKAFSVTLNRWAFVGSGAFAGSELVPLPGADRAGRDGGEG